LSRSLIGFVKTTVVEKPHRLRQDLDEAYEADVECSDGGGDFTDIGDQVEADNISVAVTEGEIESQIEAVKAADASVQSAAAEFKATMVDSIVSSVCVQLTKTRINRCCRRHQGRRAVG
jgi:hypothetical protein